MRYDLHTYPGYKDEELTILSKFVDKTAKPESEFLTEFIGTRTHYSAVNQNMGQFTDFVQDLPIPASFHAETIEWIGVLKAVDSSTGDFVMLELGAGYGTWSVNSGVAARLKGIQDIRLYAIEGDTTRFQSLLRHYRDNGFEPSPDRTFHAAVGAEAGVARWPELPYGSEEISGGNRPLYPGDEDYLGRAVADYREVEVIPLARLIERELRWDLLHIDIQGHEYSVCRSCLPLLTARVRWIVMGTHSRKLDGEIMELFFREGWILENEKPTRFLFQPDAACLESMTIHDGTQVWRNPRFEAQAD